MRRPPARWLQTSSLAGLRMPRKRVPEVRQLSEVECGLACLTMILNYYGHGISLSELRTRSGVGRDGVSALEITRTARDLGMRLKAHSLTAYFGEQHG